MWHDKDHGSSKLTLSKSLRTTREVKTFLLVYECYMFDRDIYQFLTGEKKPNTHPKVSNVLSGL